MQLTFIELPLFTNLVAQLTDDFHLTRFQNDLLKNPTKRALMPRLRGLRKARMAIHGKSRQGGARVIYLHLPRLQTVILFNIYTKARAENLTPDQERRLIAAVETIKREFRHEN